MDADTKNFENPTNETPQRGASAGRSSGTNEHSPGMDRESAIVQVLQRTVRSLDVSTRFDPLGNGNLGPREALDGQGSGLGEAETQSPEQRRAECLRKLEQDASGGNGEAQCQLGIACDQGLLGRPQDDKLALEWLTKAAKQDNATAQFILACWHQHGKRGRVAKNVEEFVKWCQKAAAQGYVPAQYQLGEYYWKGSEEPDYGKAFKWFYKAGEKGHPKAQSRLGECYAKGLGVEKNFEEACKYYKQAAQQGDSLAKHALGEMCERGEGGLSSGEAVKWYQEAAAQGYPDSQNRLGEMYRDGAGVEKNEQLAFQWIMKAAQQEDAEAQNNLGELYEQGRGTQQSVRDAYNQYCKAAEQGHRVALFKLGCMYEVGVAGCVTRSRESAVGWLRKSADQGYEPAQIKLVGLEIEIQSVKRKLIESLKELKRAAGKLEDKEAQFQLGVRYAQGIGLPQNDDSAVEWFTKAANQGDPRAQFNLACRYQQGRGVKKDMGKSVEWFQKASGQGCAAASYQRGEYYWPDSEETSKIKAFNAFSSAATRGVIRAKVRVGDCFAKGQGAEKNLEKARKYYEKAAEAGDALAQHALGKLYEEGGGGLERNDDRAIEEYKKSAERGHLASLNSLGELYLKKGGSEKEYQQQALECFKKAAGQGDAEAQTNLGDLYEQGLGTQQGDRDAYNQYCKAAEQGHKVAQFKLGCMYLAGRYVGVNKKEAIIWLSKSAKQGYEPAKTKLKELGMPLDGTQ